MAILTNTMLQGSSADTGEDAYQIENSLRFNDPDTPSLTRTFSTGNTRTWTWAAWVKRSKTGVQHNLFSAYADGNNQGYLVLESDDAIAFDQRIGGTWSNATKTTRLFRDLSAWFHITFVFDSHNAVEADRIRIYINGKRETSFSDAPNCTQYLEGKYNSGIEHQIGKGQGGSNHMDGYLADVQFIDGLALSPAAFGSFDSTGVWNPKEFSLPAPNTGLTWESTGSATGFSSNASYVFAKAFNGVATSGYASMDGVNGTGVWSGLEIPTSTNEVRIRAYNGSTPIKQGCHIKTDIGQVNYHFSFTGSSAWETIQLPAGSSKITEFSWKNNGSGNTIDIWAIEVDGVMLVSGQTDPTTRNNPNNGTTWSSYGDDTNINSSYPWTKAFDGVADGTYGNGAGADDGDGWARWTPTGGITVDTLLRINTDNGTSAVKVKFSSGSNTAVQHLTSLTDGWNTVDGSGTLEYIEIYNSGSDWSYLCGVEIDGQLLIDGSVDNSFHLKSNDTSSNTALGYDSLSTTDFTESQTAKGGPILKTDISGQILTSGTNTDPDSSNLKLAIANSATDSSSAGLTITFNGNAKNSTAQSKFYGSSIKLDGDGDNITTSGSPWSANGNATFECWVYKTTGDSEVLWDTTSKGSLTIMSTGKIELHPVDSNYQESDLTVPQNKWTHIAFTQTSSARRLWINGDETTWGSATGSPQTAAWTGAGNGIRLGSGASHGGFADLTGYIQDIRIYDKVKYTANFKPPTRNDFNVSGLWNADQQEVVGRVLISDATGARPFWETTDELGGTRSGTSVRSGEDTNLSWCLPFHESSGTPEYHNGSGIGSVSGGGSPSQSSDQSRFYGYSHYFPQNSRYSMTGPSGTFTWQAWCYFTNGGQQGLFSSQGSDNQGGTFRVSTSGYMGLWTKFGSSSHSAPNGIIPTNEWVHIAIQYDATNDVYKNFVNGEQKYSASESNNPGGSYELGTSYSGTNNFTLNGCYLSDVRMYSVAKYTEDGFTVPKLGTTYDRRQSVFVDSPTDYTPATGSDSSGGVTRGNYCTWNPLNSSATLREGNLRSTVSGKSSYGTFLIPNTGKWYWEIEANSASYIGVDNRICDGSDYLHYNPNGQYQKGDGSTTNYGASFTTGDFIGVALNMDDEQITFYKNNTTQGVINLSAVNLTDKDIVPLVYADNSAEIIANFGQRAFKYAAPTGYKCLCTQNLDDTFSGDELNNPSKYFDIKTYTGTDAAGHNIKGFKFQPDLVWIKARDQSYSHALTDAVRGVNKYLAADKNNDEESVSNALTAFNSDGFTVSNDQWFNGPHKYVTFCWDAGTAAATPSTDGSMTLSGQWVNATAGFSITTYTGTEGGSFGHALGAKPDFVIVKGTGTAVDWTVWHNGYANTKYLKLNDNSALNTWNVWGDTDPTNTTVTVSGDSYTGNNGDAYIAYCWTAIEGYSAFGTYTGNGDANGPFVYTGFKPRWFLMKELDDATNWLIYDSERNVSNPTSFYLFPNTNAGGNTYEAANTNLPVDFLSNGFKLRNSNSGTNANGDTYIYAAFAEHPFKLARAK